MFSSFFRKWQYAENALRVPDPFEADIVLDPHDVKVPPFIVPPFGWVPLFVSAYVGA